MNEGRKAAWQMAGRWLLLAWEFYVETCQEAGVGGRNRGSQD